MGQTNQITANAQAEKLFERGITLLLQKQDAKAERCFQHAIMLAPLFSEAYVNLGYMLERRGAYDSAEHYYRQALQLGAQHHELFLNLGALLICFRRFAEALTVYDKALRLNPYCPEIWSNLGLVHVGLKNDQKAENSYRQALALNPELTSASINLAHLLLRKGQFVEGWQRLHARDWYRELGQRLTIPRWQGQELTGASILITCEAGHGDMIQFCRYTTELKKAGAVQVGVLCQPALKRLFWSLDDADIIIALDEQVSLDYWDYWSPALSLPNFCATQLETIPAQIPYLHALPQLPQKQSVKNAGGCLKIGLVWKGNPNFESDHARSLPHLALLTPLWSVPDVAFFSLQKGIGAAEPAMIVSTCPITKLGPLLTDFADTAAAIMALDLIISVDTAVAHLAGALGKQCWVLLPDFNTDWRWLEQRDDSPWYPECMRLFRQSRTDDWESVILRVQSALHDLMQKR